MRQAGFTEQGQACHRIVIEKIFGQTDLRGNKPGCRGIHGNGGEIGSCETGIEAIDERVEIVLAETITHSL